MNNNKEFNNYVEQIKLEFPNFEVIPKDESFLMKLAYYGLLMKFWNPTFMTTYITVLFGKVYMPRNFIGIPVMVDVLRHELVHLRDAKKFPFLFELTYVLFPLPIVFTMRAYWEFRGYCESIRAISERYGYVSENNIDFFVEQFTGPSYLWMCPFPKFVKNKFIKFTIDNNIKVSK